MRQLILKISVSVDGFVGTPDGDVTWLFPSMSDDAAAWVLDKISNASMHLMGSRTFQDMAAYWPTSTEPFAKPMNDIPKLVFSKKGIIKPGDTENSTGALKSVKALNKDLPKQTAQMGSWINARVESDLVGTINTLKQGSGKPLVAHGGAGFIQSLIAADLIDEYNLVVHPVALGTGLPLFPPLAKPKHLKLVEVKAFKGGIVVHTYTKA